MGYASLGEAIPQLANLTFRTPSALPINAGGQNITHCCLVAMNQSLNVDGPNGTLSFNTPSYFLPALTIPDLESAVSGGGGGDSFPCGASWSGDPAGAPVVRVPYGWCRARCGGWERSRADVLSQWIGPLVQFILPSLAFCLNVPRVRRLRIPDGVFRAHPRSARGLATYGFRVGWALLLMTADTFVWLSVCFAFAGPMLLSAVYEFVLDRKVLEFLSPPGGRAGRGWERRERPVVSDRLKAQLLLGVVVGNLRLSTGRRSSTFTDKSVRSDQEEPRLIRSCTSTTTVDPLADNTWLRVMSMIDDGDKDPRVGGRVSLSMKLKAILDSQPSFGTTIGGPILFFVGGFIYTTIDIHTNSLGDDDTAHALAFGMWYMTVPHLAIIASAMLAAESPSTLQGIVWDGGSAASRDRFEKGFWDSVKTKMQEYSLLKWLLGKVRGYEVIENTYDGQFKTVSLWNRGPNKRRWVQEALRDYEASYAAVEGGIEGRMAPKDVRAALREDWGDVVNATIATACLLVVPSALAFLTSYNTPRKGISCRTLTYLVYGITQVVECLFWAWEICLKIKYGDRWSEAHTGAKTINWMGQMVVGFVAIFAAVIGTLMQLLGVYRTCACMVTVPSSLTLLEKASTDLVPYLYCFTSDKKQVPISYWVRPNDPGAYVDLSTNDAASIKAASEYWVTTGAVAVGFICLICALGWWHQRRLKKLFKDEAESLDKSCR